MANNQWYMEQLKTPIRTGAVGLTPAERQARYSLARRNIRGSTAASVESLKAALGNKGFRAGQSGFADTALSRMISQGAEREAASAQDLALQDIQNEQNLRAQTAELNLGRLTGAGQIGVGFAQAAAQGAAAKYAAKTAAERLAWEKEKFKDYEYPYQQQEDAWSRMQWLYGSMLNQQGQDWDRYAQGY